MKRLLLLGALFVLPCFVMRAEAPQEAPALQQQVASSKEVALRIESLTSEQIASGITEDMIRNEIMVNLQKNNISINDSISQPVLVVKIQTMKVGLDYATYIQLSLFEESMLVRNRSMFSAQTWSQALIMSCRPENLKKEVIDSIDILLVNFSKDFQKAFQSIK